MTWKTYHPIERSIFQNVFITYLRPDSSSSQKTVYTNCLHFFESLTGNQSNMQKKLDRKGKLNSPSFFKFFCKFDQLPVWIFKKGKQFVHVLLWEESESGLRFVKKSFSKIDLSIGGYVFQVNFRQTRCQQWGWKAFEIPHQSTYPLEKIRRNIDLSQRFSKTTLNYLSFRTNPTFVGQTV